MSKNNGRGLWKKKYLSQKCLGRVRSKFRTRFGLQPFAGNYSHDRHFARSQWLCKCKVSVESKSHLLEGSCPVYGEINHKYTDLNNEEQLIIFFNEVLAKREMIEDDCGGYNATDNASPGQTG